MPHSPLISKIRCPNPNLGKKIRIMNRNHVIYIATREGVDLSPDPPTGNKEYDDRNTKIDEEMKETNPLKNTDYLKYIQERPKSHGLFGNIDTENIVDLGNKIADMTKQGKCIYRGIISLSEQDALELGYTNKKQWELYMNSAMYWIRKEFNIDINDFRWVAAFHMEPTHPHCHYMFWDSSSKIHSSYIHLTKQHACREALSKEMFHDEYIIAVMEKSDSRKNILEFSQSINDELSNILTDMQIGIPGHLKHKELNELTNQLISFSQTLPATGRLNYKFLPPDTKKELDRITAQILQFPAIRKEYLNYIEQYKTINASYSQGNTKKEAVLNKQLADLNTRLGNQLLKTCKEILQKRDFLAEYGPSVTPEPPVHEPDIPGDSGEPGSPEWDYLLPEDDADTLNNHYRLSWTSNYKKALNLIYHESAPDYETAVKLLQTECNKNNILAFQMLGKIYEKELVPDPAGGYAPQLYYSEAFQGFNKLLNSPDYPDKADYLNYVLGKMYESGTGTPVNYGKAIELYSASNSQHAQYALGNMYLRGKGIEITQENKASYHKKALELFRKSAASGNAYAAYLFAQTSETNNFLQIPDSEINAMYKNALSGFQGMLEKQRNDNLLYKLGCMYRDGKGTDKSADTAFQYFNKAAVFNNENAKYALAKMYLDKETPFYDPNAGLELLEKISESGSNLSQYAQYTLGKLYAESEPNADFHNPEKGIELFKRSLNSEHIREHALFALGKLYSDPESPSYHLETGTEYFKESANLGNSYAQYRLGKLYLEESSLNIPLALQYLNMAAEQDNDMALYTLGRYYSNPENQSYDLLTAKNLLERSADKGNSYSQCQLGKLYLKEDLLKVPKALKYLNLAAEQDNDIALYTLGRYYSDAENPSYDIHAAIHFLEKSADNSNSYSQCLLGKIYLEETNQNVALALKYLSLAAEQENDVALYTLGQFYCNKENPSYDIHTAIHFLKKSADKGNAYALAKLGSIHLWGSHTLIPKDIDLGKKYLLEAVSHGNTYAQDTLNMYENYCNNIIFRGVFKAVLDCFRSLAYQNRQSKLNSMFQSTDYKKLRARQLKGSHEQGKELE